MRGQRSARLGVRKRTWSWRKDRKKRHEGGGRRRAVRPVGGCCDGGMLLDIFSVDGEEGQGRKNGPPKIGSPRNLNMDPPELKYEYWTPSEKLGPPPRDEIM